MADLPDLTLLKKQLEKAQQQLGREGLRGGSGDGTSGGMEARVAALEAHLDHVRGDMGGLKADVSAMRNDVGTLKTDLGSLKTRVEGLPTKTFVVQALVGGMAIFAAVLGFADLIRKLLHLG